MVLVLFICIYFLELLLPILDTIKVILKKPMCNIIFVLSGVIFFFFFFTFFKGKVWAIHSQGAWQCSLETAKSYRRAGQGWPSDTTGWSSGAAGLRVMPGTSTFNPQLQYVDPIHSPALLREVCLKWTVRASEQVARGRHQERWRAKEVRCQRR